MNHYQLFCVILPTFSNALLCTVASQHESSLFQSLPVFLCGIGILTLNQQWYPPTVQRRVNWSFYIAHRRECELCFSTCQPCDERLLSHGLLCLHQVDPVVSLGQAVFWLWCGFTNAQDCFLTTWFKSGFCFSPHNDFWNEWIVGPIPFHKCVSFGCEMICF